MNILIAEILNEKKMINETDILMKLSQVLKKKQLKDKSLKFSFIMYLMI